MDRKDTIKLATWRAAFDLILNSAKMPKFNTLTTNKTVKIGSLPAAESVYKFLIQAMIEQMRPHILWQQPITDVLTAAVIQIPGYETVIIYTAPLAIHAVVRKSGEITFAEVYARYPTSKHVELSFHPNRLSIPNFSEPNITISPISSSNINYHQHTLMQTALFKSGGLPSDDSRTLADPRHDNYADLAATIMMYNNAVDQQLLNDDDIRDLPEQAKKQREAS